MRVNISPSPRQCRRRAARAKAFVVLSLRPTVKPCSLLADRAYEGNETRQLICDLEFSPVIPPNPNRLKPWKYDKELYKRRNEVERLFRRLKGFRRVFTRYDKLDVMFLIFVVFALIVEDLR
ncbi:MAG: transposase [Desulfovibrio sp.]|nr:transposase [Desulfovibrio sp.]